MPKPQRTTMFARIEGYTADTKAAVIKAVRDNGGVLLPLKDGEVLAVCEET